jgi:hypothetical protein
MYNTVRFLSNTGMLASNIVTLLVGGPIMWASIIVTVIFMVAADEAIGDIKDDVAPESSTLFDIIPLFSLPLFLINCILFAAYFSSAETTWIGSLLATIGLDFDSARRASSGWDVLGATLGMGILCGLALTVAHELSHRTKERLAPLIGRWDAAIALEPTFEVHHLNGHHINAGLLSDPSTARRGETYYAFLIRSTVGNNLFAWRFERDRMARRGLSTFSPKNRVMTGLAMVLAVAAIFYSTGGWAAVGAYVVAAVQGRMYLQLGVYIEHYGLLRAPGQRFEARHAWNSYREISNSTLYNAGRHSHHHTSPNKPYYRLEPDEASPKLPFGYMTMFAIVVIPPLFFRVIEPHLRNWDTNLTTDDERNYIANSGFSLLAPVRSDETIRPEAEYKA